MDHISIEVIGQGAPVILIPGMSTPRAVWDEFVPTLARTHRVILVQINGFGGDDPGANLKPGLLDGIVTDLHRYITESGLVGAAVVGHSLGGGLGLMLAKDHPADVGRLMMIEAQPYIGDIFVPGGDTVEKVEPRARAIRGEEIASFGKPIDTVAVKAEAAESALRPEAQAKLEAWIAAADPRVTGEALYEGLTTDQRPHMATIATPITVVYAWSDSLPEQKANAQFRADFAQAPMSPTCRSAIAPIS